MLFPTPIARHTARTNPLTTCFAPIAMCQAPTTSPPKPIGPSPPPSSTSNLLRHASILIPPFLRNGVFHQPPSKKKTALLVLVTLLLLSITLLTTLYTFHRGFRRTIQFWRGLAPMALQYKLLKFKSRKIDRVDDAEYQRRITAFRQRNAPQLVDLILSLGGIYVKIGQVMSTIGAGLLPEEYVRALRPLQDGVPPKRMDQISKIIQDSTGKRMDDLFVEFEERPIGAASIAQAHRATLRPSSSSTSSNETPQRVIVKVQYPEVADLFAADLSNLEWATRLFAPENLEVAKAMRKRHENELDFRIEAENLRQCASDMQRHGVEPSLVRIPRVRNETGICSKNVLVMEYLEGMSLSDVIQEEQDRVARALGKEDAAELKGAIMMRMRDHFERGGGAGVGGMNMLGGARMNLLSKVLGPAGGTLLRAYASARNGVEDAMLVLQRTTGKIRVGLGGKKFDLLEDGVKKKAKRANVNLSKALKTLVHVHGIQFMISGVYNADPHPGNVLVLPDGRLGLLDYGMVGKLSKKDRQTVAELILALNRNDKATAARIYRENGYKATLSDGMQVDDSILHRLATFHLDKIDLSKLTLDNGDTVDVLELLRGTRERAVPSWVEEGRRLGGLLQGVCVQAARPISLAKEWSSIAKDALKQK
ncbi:hypothetical protein HJC23_004949 [Cyclotella cryptica]|uniref:ABC1 atypical kinase-like domain-containing protein n=1 Tax=Cyclotella cryptica TaxID=29204 RepID=A0ABD3PSY0_9STRA|eukprot:CCRYP_011910-RA/>CCRYP_011910-RA protein AED:0.25 eAED:0.25 QI:0/1/0.5/1/1/1/2/1986/649